MTLKNSNSNWGGSRPGSGRKKGEASILAEKTKATIAKKIEENIKPLVQVMVDEALKGNMIAMRELFDRGHGKSTQAVEMEVETRRLVVDDEPNDFIPSPVELTELHTADSDDDN